MEKKSKEEPKKKKNSVPAKKKEVIIEEKIEEKKEPEVKEIHLGKEKQKRLKIASKFIYILTRIAQIFVLIGIVGLFIAMLFVPIFTTNIKVQKGVEKNYIEIFDKKIEYTRTEDKVTFTDPEDTEKDTEIKTKKEVDSLNKVLEYLEENDLSLLTISCELLFFLIAGLLFVVSMILKRVYLLFKNINNENSPFILENVELLKTITKLLIASFIISMVIDIIASLLISLSISINISFTSIMEIAIVYSAALIFEYGHKLQNTTKGKIYSEND